MDDLTIIKHLFKQLEKDLRRLETTLKNENLKSQAQNLSLFSKKTVNKKGYCQERE